MTHKLHCFRKISTVRAKIVLYLSVIFLLLFFNVDIHCTGMDSTFGCNIETGILPCFLFSMLIYTVLAWIPLLSATLRQESILRLSSTTTGKKPVNFIAVDIWMELKMRGGLRTFGPDCRLFATETSYLTFVIVYTIVRWEHKLIWFLTR